MTHVLPVLGYAYDALEPYISASIMELHHTKHHQTYVDKLNMTLDQVPEYHERSLEELLRSLESLPDTIRLAVRNHGGGHLNHSFFWQCMSPDGGEHLLPDELRSMLVARYGSFEAFVEEFNRQALGLFGSGWCWLMPDLSIVTTQNQDNPISEGKSMPILGLDVWEHAYYLDYKNKRDEYVMQWWNIVDWNFVTEQLKR